jgi:hypothetical protein
MYIMYKVYGSINTIMQQKRPFFSNYAGELRIISLKVEKKVVHESRRTQTRVQEQTHTQHTPGTRLDSRHNLQETRPAETTLTVSFLPF